MSPAAPDFEPAAERVDRTLIAPSVLNLGDDASFAVRLPVRPQPGSHLTFTYRYNGVDDVEGSAAWIQSFDAKL